MARPLKFSKKTMLKAIKDSGGLKTEIANRLNCDYRIIENYVRAYPEVKQALEDEEEKILDMAESQLYMLIQNADTSAIFFLLNNKGYKRGYGPRAVKAEQLQDNTDNESGVLVTPGLFSEELWEEEVKKN